MTALSKTVVDQAQDLIRDIISLNGISDREGGFGRNVILTKAVDIWLGLALDFVSEHCDDLSVVRVDYPNKSPSYLELRKTNPLPELSDGFYFDQATLRRLPSDGIRIILSTCNRSLDITNMENWDRFNKSMILKSS